MSFSRSHETDRMARPVSTPVSALCRLRHSTVWLVAGTLLVLPGDRPLVAQQTCAAGQSWSWVGVDVFHCPGGSCAFLNPAAGAPAFEFTTEPWLRAIDERGPAAGLLLDGDVLVAVNGFLITSVRGGEQLARLAARTPAHLTIRRGDRLHAIDVTPEARCSAPTLVHGNAVVRGLARTDDVRHVGGRNLTSHDLGLGLGLRCANCDVRHSEGAPYVPVDFPRVIAVIDDGAAARAGVREGDLIARVNGEDIRTPAGITALFGAQPGQSIRLRLITDSVVRDVTLVKSDVRFMFNTDFDGFDRHREDGIVDRFLGLFRHRDDARHRNPDDDGVRHVITDRHVARISRSPWSPAAFGLTLEACAACSWSWNDRLMGNDRLVWNVDEPLTVARVLADGPAARAGIRVGDVITHVGGHDIRSVEGGRVLLSTTAGNRIEMRFLRSGRERSVTVTTH